MLAILESIVSRTSMVIKFVSSSYLTAVSKLMFYKFVCTVVIGSLGPSDFVYFILIY